MRFFMQRFAMLGPLKNNKALALALTEDAVDAIRWHLQQEYAKPEFLFSRWEVFPRSDRCSVTQRSPCLAFNRRSIRR
jgi:hypothetical protein